MKSQKNKMTFKDLDKIIPHIRKELFRQNKNAPYILFDHLPKCAGSRIYKHLKYAYPAKNTYIFSPPYQDSIDAFKKLAEKKRLEYHVVSGHGADQLMQLVHPATFNITSLRDPVERIVSYYFYARNLEGHHLRTQIQDEHIGLDSFCKLDPNELSNYYVKHFSSFSEEAILSDPEGAIGKAIENILDRYSLIGFQDSIEPFLNQLDKHLKIKSTYPRKFENQTKKKKEINPQDLAHIKAYNSLDIEFYKKLHALRDEHKVINKLPML